MDTFKEMLEECAEKYEDRTFIIFGDQEISFREFDEMANRTADLFLRNGIRKGDKVLLFLPNCMEFFYTWCGAAKIGAVVVPTNFNLKAAELRYNVNHSESRAIITTLPYAEVFREIRDQCPGVSHCFLVGDEDVEGFVPFRFELSSDLLPPPDIQVSSDDLMLILYTSGTTGRPKGVMHSHATYLFTIQAYAREWLHEGDATLSVLPVYHVSGHIYTVFCHLVAGCKTVLADRFSASEFWNLARKYEINYMTMPLPVLLMVLAQPTTGRDREHPIQRFIASCSPQVADEFEERFGVEVFSSYGLSEDPLMIVAPYPLTETVRKKRRNPPYGGSLLGKPLYPEMHKVKIVNDEHQELPPGASGRILKKDPGSMLGYFRDPEQTRKTIIDGWVDTGDYGYKDEDGFIYFLDRTKDIIRRSGENISSREIEDVLNAHPAIEASAVIPVPDPIRVEEVKAYIVPQKGYTIRPQEIIKFCAERVADFKIPRYIDFRESFPRSADFKIQKSVLKNEKPDLITGCYDRMNSEQSPQRGKK